MKNGKLFIVFFLFLLFSSCRPDVDIYTDYRELPVVYALIDAQADTNFIRINRAFYVEDENLEDIHESILLSDSSNYSGKINAYFEELKSSSGGAFQPTGRKLLLDTLTKQNKLYYTTERFNTNSGNDKYRYKLCIVLPNADTVTAETGMVKNDIALSSPTPDYYTNTPLLDFTPSITEYGAVDFSPTEEAVLYEISVKFNYREGHTDQPMVEKEVSWSYGQRHLMVYEKIPSSNFYRLHYQAKDLFVALEQAFGNDTVWDMNHPNVIRYYDGVEVTISAAGEAFYNYYQLSSVLQQGLGASLEYSNIEGGYGVLSSRTLVTYESGITGRTKYELFCKPWGFLEH